MDGVAGVAEFIAKVEGGGTTPFWVSERDAAWVACFSWWCNRDGYIYRQTSERRDGKRRNVTVFLHREVLGLERKEPLQGDHLNFDRLDCRRENLEIRTLKENVARRREIKGYVNEGPPLLIGRVI